MITRISQRNQDDCTFCAIAMVMGRPYSYERVLADSAKYQAVTPDNNFLAWWEYYLRDEGFQAVYRPFLDLHILPQFAGELIAVLGMDIPQLRKSHIVAVDEFGIVDPAENAPDHIDVNAYVLKRLSEGFLFSIRNFWRCEEGCNNRATNPMMFASDLRLPQYRIAIGFPSCTRQRFADRENFPWPEPIRSSPSSSSLVSELVS
jgi:hypothetical protein